MSTPPLDFDVVKRHNAKVTYSEDQMVELMNCQDDPMYFMRNFLRIQHSTRGALPFNPYPYQVRLVEAFHTHTYNINMSSRQTGKALALNTPIPTPTGWTTMGEIKVGDKILSSDGLPTEVIFATEVMHDHDCYQIEFDTGETVIADADHLWPICHDKTRLVCSTVDLISLFEKRQKWRQSIYVETTSPVVGIECDLPVPSYTLGVWLGDDNSGDGRFYGHKDDCDEMRNYVSSDVLNNKHIPPVYLRASVNQRLELLRGLMDTDGYTEKRNGCCEIVQKSLRLAIDICELLASLGIKARRNEKTVHGVVYHRITFATKNCDRLYRHTKNIRYFIKSICKTASVAVRCIQVDSNNSLFLCTRSMIPTHNTTCAQGYILWRAMFVPDSTILITANTYNMALEIMERIRYAYENVPNHIRDGVREYNKGSIVFSNGSRIISRATTPNAGRGLSISLLFIDEFAAIHNKMAARFWTSIRPTLATGGSCIITSTPQNDEDQFSEIWHGANNNHDAHGNLNPGGVGINGFYATMVPWYEHPDRDEKWAETERAAIGEAKFSQEHECKFVSDVDTLINPMTLYNMKPIDPIFYTGQVRWYAEPAANHGFLVGLDPSLGTDNDYAAIQVFQLPEMIQVAEWQHNRTDTRRQVTILMEILLELEAILIDDPKQIGPPEIYWTFENNSIGEAILQIVEDTGEDQFPGALITERKRKGMPIKRVRKGLNTTAKNRLSALAKMKTLIETDRMTVNSRALLRELKNFVATEGTFRARPGEHDDAIMATTLLVRMIPIILSWGTVEGKLRDLISNTSFEDIDLPPMPLMIS
jgi:hypothetical protein